VTRARHSIVLASGKRIIYKTVLGDLYVTDMNRTKGHKSLLNDACWNPQLNANEIMTCADDCTIRLWSLNKRDQQLHVIRTKGESGRDVRTTTCTYSQSVYHDENSNLIAAGCENGSILIWDRRRSFVHVTFKCYNAHLSDESITSLKWSYDTQVLASRSTDHTLKLWDMRKFDKPLFVSEHLPNHFSMTNISFSPNDRFVVTGVSKSINESDSDVGKLLIFTRNDLSKPRNELTFNDSVIRTIWHPKLNQIFSTTNNGLVRVFYDVQRSAMAGVQSCLNRKERKSKNADDFVANIDSTDDALSSSDHVVVATRRIAPDKPTSSSTSFHEHVVQTRTKTFEKDDPRVELSKHAQQAQLTPERVTPAHVHAQPKPLFQQQLDEEDEQEKHVFQLSKRRRND
jgi:WD repeat-containing protein 70